MPSTSKRLLAIQDLKDRLSHIQVAKGYHTDAGLYIFLGEAPRQGKDDPDAALAIFLLSDEALEGGGFTQGGLVRYRVPIEVQGLLKVPANVSPLIAYEGLIADIKEAAEIEGKDPGTNAATDRYLGVIAGTPNRPVTLPKGFERGATRIHYREGGSEIASVVVEYFAALEEIWGRP